MSDRTDRSERLRRRFDRPVRTDEGEGAGAGEDESGGDAADATDAAAAESTDRTRGAGEEGTETASRSASVKERPSTLMYLPEDVDRDLDLTFDEVNLKYRRAFDEKLEKNRDYYPLVARYGLERLKEWDADDIRDALEERR